jgi:Spy/CpxP family protein refolding chaperone
LAHHIKKEKNMSYKPFLLVAAGVMIGAVTFGAMSASAHKLDDSGDGERRGHFGEHNSEGKMRGAKHGMKFSEELLGLTADELKAEREAGKTMEQIVTENGYNSIESFKDAVEQKVREELAAEGLSEEEIDEKIAEHEERRQHRLEHMAERFDEDDMRERLSEKGLSDEQIEERIQHIKDRISELDS